VVSTIAGGINGPIPAFIDGTGTQTGFSRPNGVIVDAAGNVIIADTDNQRIRKLTPAGGTPSPPSPSVLGGVAFCVLFRWRCVAMVVMCQVSVPAAVSLSKADELLDMCG
jgi:hypothetical protein